jgi:hypothetical protein
MNGKTDWIDGVEFPGPWVDLRRRRSRLSNWRVLARHRRELSVEIARGHVLHGRRWRIIGIGVPARDEVLLALADGEIALTHVTWRGAPEPPSWPMTTIVSSAGELWAELADRGFSTD